MRAAHGHGVVAAVASAPSADACARMVDATGAVAAAQLGAVQVAFRGFVERAEQAGLSTGNCGL